MLKLLLILALLSLTFSVNAQGNFAELMQAAKDSLQKKEVRFSKKHIKYQKAALKYASLIYFNPDVWQEADIYAKPALRFIRNKFGAKSDEYAQALQAIPSSRAQLFDADFDLAEAKKKVESHPSPQNQLQLAEKQIKSAAASINNDDWFGYDKALKAFRLLHQLAYPKDGEIYQYAAEVLPPYVLNTLQNQLKLDIAKKEKHSPHLLAETLTSMAEVILLYDDSLGVNLQYDSVYLYLKHAMRLYQHLDDTIGYNSAVQTMTTDMKSVFPLEKAFYTQINSQQPPNDSFFFNLQPFLAEVDRVIFLTYNNEQVCRQATQYVHEQTDSSSPYRQTIQAICEKLYVNESVELLQNQKDFVAEALDLFGPQSAEYAAELIKLANYQTKELDERTALKNYLKAFGILEDLELLSLDNPIFQSYFQSIPKPWNVYLRNELEIKTFQSVPDRTGKLLAEAYFKAGYDYFDKWDMTDRAERYYRLGIKTLDKDYKFEAIKWLDKLFRIEPEWGPPALAQTMVQEFSRPQVLDVLAFPLDSMAKQYGKRSSEFAKMLAIKGDVYFFDEELAAAPDSAFNLYNKALALYEEEEGQNFSYLKLLIRIISNIEAYGSPWHVEISNGYFEQLLRILKRANNQHYPYHRYLQKYADWHNDNNRFIAAEPLYKEYFELFANKSIKEKRGSTYGKAQYNIARIYRKTGRFIAAFEAYQNAMSIAKETRDFLLYVRCVDDYGLLMQQYEQDEKAFQFFTKALEVMKLLDNYPIGRLQFASSALLYVKIMRHIGRWHLDAGAYEKAKDYFDGIVEFEETSPYVSFYLDHSLKRDLALLYDRTGYDSKALRYYRLAIKQLDDQAEKADAMVHFAQYYTQRTRLDSAKQLYLGALRLDAEQIRLNYPNLSEEERLLFLQPISQRINDFMAFVAAHPDSLLLVEALNAHLMIKGLALENTNNIRDAIVNSDNVLLNEWNNDLLMLRKQLANAATLSEKSRKERGIDIGAISAKIKNLEKKLSRESKALRQAFDKQNKQLSFEKLQSLLPKGEVAIDFLTIERTDEYGEKSSRYYALLVHPDSSQPTMVPLAEEYDIATVLDSEVAPNTINYITDALESNYLYFLVWEPLRPHIDSANTLHLCPTGILSKIAFTTLRMTDYNRQRIMDKWSVHYYSSLRDLLKTTTDPEDLHQRIALVGGVRFSLNQQQLQQIAKAKKLSLEEANELLMTPSVAMPAGDRGARGEDFGYLPGTLEEVEAIRQLFQKRGWQTQMLTGTAALEENVEAIDTTSPDILHIATHGFFFSSNTEASAWLSEDKITDESVEERLATNEDPLLRSGLAMTGINVIWKDGKEVEGLEDGILFAKEVAGMNLFDTELVVLSACETGRGDIDNNEGIMGLQRAFKTAGAKKLIISLWKVPDQQTSELMQYFYAAYLKNNDAHLSFEMAQHAMRKKYTNPYYWAAFVLIE